MPWPPIPLDRCFSGFQRPSIAPTPARRLATAPLWQALLYRGAFVRLLVVALPAGWSHRLVRAATADFARSTAIAVAGAFEPEFARLMPGGLRRFLCRRRRRWWR